MTIIKMTETCLNSECLNKTITIWGWVFDIGTVFISLADVVSDILVARQFWKDGETTWFWLVISSLMLSNIIYSIFGAEVVLDGLGQKVHRVLRFVMIFPIAQLVPTIFWIQEQVSPRSIITLRYSPWSMVQKHSQTAPRAVQEEGDAMASEVQMIERLDRGLKKHLNTHLLFYIETIVESIPQSIIQLLAVTFLGQATDVQVLSMALSLLSIVSKGYVISYSFSVKIVFFKFFLAAFDIFSLFYVFSTLLGREEPDEVHLGGNVWISYLSYMWLIKFGVMSSYIALGAIIAGIAGLSRSSYQKSTFETVGLAILEFLAGCLLAAPVALAVEGAKLIWIVGSISNSEPSRRSFPSYARLYAFLNRGQYNERLRHIHKQHLLAVLAEGNCNMYIRDEEFERTKNMLRKADPDERRAQGLPVTVEEAVHEVLRGSRLPREEVMAQLVSNDVVHNDQWRAALVVQCDEFDPSLLEYYGSTLCCSNSLCTGHGNLAVDTFLAGYMRVGTLLYIMAQLYSCIFPFISFGMHFHTQNLLQRFSFYATCIPVFFIVLLSPAAWRYYTFARYNRRLLPNIMDTKFDDWVSKYHMPPHAKVIGQGIPSGLLPEHVTELLTTFMVPSHVVLSMLSIRECRQRKAGCPRGSVLPKMACDVHHCESEWSEPYGNISGTGNLPLRQQTNAENAVVVLVSED